MKKTYTLYLLNGDGDRHGFEPALCETDAEAIGRARELIEGDAAVSGVEVCFDATTLFRVHRAGGGGWE